mmetsp:Transcript_37181/g.90188  ORF Transcript_37181/g.90188 Transcript_37181/m.90188 type:complete len:100 (+) Transcript_37181:252-551(+)
MINFHQTKQSMMPVDLEPTPIAPFGVKSFCSPPPPPPPPNQNTQQRPNTERRNERTNEESVPSVEDSRCRLGMRNVYRRILTRVWWGYQNRSIRSDRSN